jgi:hypothetical protein
MILTQHGLRRWLLVVGLLIYGFTAAVPDSIFGKEPSDAEVAKELVKQNNKVIIEEFLKYELGEVNQHVTRPLLKNHESLEFFIKQAERGPLNNLLFLETQVHKLRDAQKNINSLPYSISFSSGEKKKILGLRSVADRIVSYGIPLMKREFLRVVEASKEVADKKNKHPMALMRDPAFRDAVYRFCEPTAQGLDEAMGKLSEGELICIRLGWTLEEVTITRLWLVLNDNWLPKEDDYLVFRKKRSEWFQNRLKRIYGDAAAATPTSSKSGGK